MCQQLGGEPLKGKKTDRSYKVNARLLSVIFITSNEKFKKCKKVGIEKKVNKQDGMSTIIVTYSDKIIRR